MAIVKENDNIRSVAKKMLKKDSEGFERVVAGEMLIPYVFDVFGDIYTPEMIRRFAYTFAAAGFNTGSGSGGSGIGLDIEHDNVDITGKYVIVESYIAKADDPDGFREGAWVLVSWIQDDDLWNSILAGDLVGYSYEAYTFSLEVDTYGDYDRFAVGETEPDLYDGHTHRYFCILDENGRVKYGGTSEVNGHSHEISVHSSTNESYMHKHRFNLTLSQ